MKMQPILNIDSPCTQMELEFDMIGIAKKLVKQVVHLFKRKKLKKKGFSSHRVPKQQTNSSWS
jgi:hypothetical protein